MYNKNSSKVEIKFSLFMIIVIAILLIVFLGYFLYFKNDKKMTQDELYNEVILNENKWDLFFLQNKISSGDLMGKIYERDYTVNNLDSSLISALIVDNYINNNDFFLKENLNGGFYRKEVNENVLKKLVLSMFGPDVNIDVADIEYGCGRSLKKKGNSYVVSAKLPDSCGMLSTQKDRYYAFIKDYYEENDEIKIKIKVGFVVEDSNEGEIEDDEEIKVNYTVYDSKNKKKILVKNLNYQCLLQDNNDSSCYDNFLDYVVTLKKASDGNFYFYSIEKN